MNLKGKVAVISGANGALGRITTKSFAEAGAKLVLLGRSSKNLDKMAAHFGINPADVLSIALDLGNIKETQKAASLAIDKFDRLDIFINLVGGWAGGKAVHETDIDEIDAMIHQHIRTSYSMVKAFLPPMLKNSWGRLLAVSSPHASQPPGHNSPFAIGKAGLEALMLSLAEELKASGVTSNLVLVETIDVKHERINNPSEKNSSWSTPEEISATLLHLCTEEANNINGARIPLYGSP
jgi:NAD(P)-dependent dehydrogenase (short-subunit alcohol dehydrogenase family)